MKHINQLALFVLRIRNINVPQWTIPGKMIIQPWWSLFSCGGGGEIIYIYIYTIYTYTCGLFRDTSKWQIFNIGLNGAQWGSIGLNGAQWGSINLNTIEKSGSSWKKTQKKHMNIMKNFRKILKKGKVMKIMKDFKKKHYLNASGSLRVSKVSGRNLQGFGTQLSHANARARV